MGALLVGAAVTTAPSAAAGDTFNQKVTCKKGQVRSKPAGKGTVKGHVYQSTKDWGHITKSYLGKDGNISYWYGTWHHKSKSAKGWVKLVCADPRAS